MKFTAAIPLIFSMVSFVLTMLALFAGSKKGFMEDYHIIVFNTSTLGQNFVESMAKGDSSSTATTASATATTTSSGGILGGGIGGIISTIEASATAVVGSIESEAASILNDVGNDIADKLADDLGIDQFYTLHVMDLCQGDFAPNATSKNPSYNVTNCTTSMDFSEMDITSLLNQQLSIGPFNISLSDLGITQKLENKLSSLPQIFEALCAIYIISAGFTGLSILSALVGMFLLPQKGGRKLVLVELVLALTGTLFLFIGSLLYTIGGKEAVKKIHESGADDIGLKVSVGSKFEALTWAAFALMAIAAGYWVYEFVVMTKKVRRERKMARGMEKHSMESSRSRRGGWGF